MPHMMPMLWILMFILTLLTFYIIMTLIYFFYLPNIKHKKLTLLNSPKMKWTWKW